MRKLVDLFCHVDDFCKAFLPQWQKLQLESGERKRNRKGRIVNQHRKMIRDQRPKLTRVSWLISSSV